MNKRIAGFLLCLLLFGLPCLFAQSAAAHYNEGRAAMLRENWYEAAESFLEVLRLNPSHAEAAAALAECYYELGEFDEALVRVRKGRSLARGNLGLANLEASILIALGRLGEASAIISDVLAREPYNREALFAQAEMDIARGRAGEAVTRYREVARRYPDDQRVLLSLGLVLGSLGEYDTAKTYIDRALARHSEDYRVYYYAAYLDSRAGRLSQAVRHAERALFYRPGFTRAKILLANLRYRLGQYDQAVQLADEIIAGRREETGAWYLKGMAFSMQGRVGDAVSVLSTAAGIAPDDEFIRGALEDLLISATSLEEPGRRRWAAWHFARARDYRARNLSGEALFEYRRGLRLNPYAPERRDYANILRVQGFPARFMEELRFMQDIGLGDQGIDDAVESYTSLLSNALYRRWQADPLLVTKRHWKLAVFSVAAQSGFFHADAGAVASAYCRDILSHDRNIAPLDAELRQNSFSGAFRTAREHGADYFLVISVTESDRDISLLGELFVGRTGSPAGLFRAYRTGPDRLRNAAKNLLDQITAALPFRGEIAARKAGQALIDKGRADGVRTENVYDIVKKGALSVKNSGIGLSYGQGDLAGSIAITEADEEVSSGNLSRNGFFDRIEAGDEVILRNEKDAPPAPDTTSDPELRTLLRSLR
ncbi:MAG: tetratricopeptide repeat protein [Treponema sp.]|jgi:tetratricopeptide (TPR) repeat protein|nr:tetratricopeptide repeat protein [Treponema sp.]